MRTMRVPARRPQAQQPVPNRRLLPRRPGPLCPRQHLSDPAHGPVRGALGKHGVGRLQKPLPARGGPGSGRGLPGQPGHPVPQTTRSFLPGPDRAPPLAPAPGDADLGLPNDRPGRPLGDARRLPARDPRLPGQAGRARHRAAGPGAGGAPLRSPATASSELGTPSCFERIQTRNHERQDRGGNDRQHDSDCE